jgi:PhzF family phenazine biosynthesis protein
MGSRDYHSPRGLATVFACFPQANAATHSKMEVMRIPLFHIDAFTNQPFQGNPAAVCLLDAWLDDESLQKVAAENNLSATAFFVRGGHLPGVGACDLRWFTPRCEIRLCGHATLATAYVALSLLESSIESVRFETRFSGPLTVRKSGEAFCMDFPALGPKSLSEPPVELLRALGHAPVGSARVLEVLEVNDTYFVVYETQSAVQDIRPDLNLLEQLHPFAVSLTAPGDDVNFVSRYFAPSYGVPEDPVTGSAHCALAPYWSRRLRKTSLHARQLSERGGEIFCEMAGDRVIIKGSAVLTLKGTIEF